MFYVKTTDFSLLISELELKTCHCFVSRAGSLRQKVRLRTGQISSVKENGDQRKASGVNVMKNIVKSSIT